MKQHKLTSTLIALFALLIGCGDNDPSAVVVVSGDHSVQVAQTAALTAETSNGTDSSYSWASGDESVATVNAEGEVTAVAAGEAIITATGVDTDAVGSHAIVVGQPVVVIAGSGVVLVGEMTGLTATTENGIDAGYSWSSDNESVAVVDAAGMVTGAAVGSVTITATGSDTGMTATLSLVVSAVVPNYEGWAQSGHADFSAEAFRHWDDDGEISESCARCHSSGGFLDYIGEDSTEVGVVDGPAELGTVISCTTCHNAAADALSTVTFPSGVMIEELGSEAICMTCHQGRSSSDTVDTAIASAGVGEDVVSADLSFINIHYYAAAATLIAGRARGGYQYEAELGAVYDWRFRHVAEKETCIGCHDPHSLEVRINDCDDCHTGVTDIASVKDIRMMGSVSSDYDGDGNLTEGIFYEIQGLREQLLSNIKTYATDNSLGAICYGAQNYPYWFLDTDANGDCNTTEASYGNRFASWTPRLLKAAYNYQVATKDPGAFAHNAKYTIQLLHDSLVDLNEGLTAAVDLSALDRNDPGHFNGASEAARHWDEDEAVSASCSKCHGGSEGFRFYVQFGVGATVEEQDNGLDCATCHEDLSSGFDLLTVTSTTYPSGIEIADPVVANNLCSTCHAGRESKATIDAKIASGSLSFRNVHYLPAGAIKKGGAAQVGYEYDGKTYAPDWDHAPANECTFCHDPVGSGHSFVVADVFDKCTALCHTTAVNPVDIRGNPFAPGLLHPLDYDGDGDATENLIDELSDLADGLLLEIQSTASAGGGAICYGAGSYPYWFTDTNGNSVCDGAEAIYPNRFTAWTPALMKAAHNYQITRTDPGAWAHNFDYVAQLLIDSMEDLGGAGAITGFIRP